MGTWEPTWKISCAGCGKDFELLMGRARLKLMNGKRVLYCSKSCANKYRKLSMKIKDKSLGNYAYGKCICEICGTEFQYNKTKRGRKYCSRKCTYAAQAERGRNGTLNLLSSESRKKAFKGNKNALSNGSVIEGVMKATLINNNITFEEEYKIRNTVTGGCLFLDFAIPELKIDIECDGEYWHTAPKFVEKDKKRDEFLKSEGWTILRFPGRKITKEIENCLEEIVEKIKDLKTNPLSV